MKDAVVKRKKRSMRMRRAGTAIIWPAGVQERYGIGYVTRWRWEKVGLLPKRDVYIGGILRGWKPTTLDKWDRGERV